MSALRFRSSVEKLRSQLELSNNSAIAICFTHIKKAQIRRGEGGCCIWELVATAIYLHHKTERRWWHHDLFDHKFWAARQRLGSACHCIQKAIAIYRYWVLTLFICVQFHKNNYFSNILFLKSATFYKPTNFFELLSPTILCDNYHTLGYCSSCLHFLY